MEPEEGFEPSTFRLRVGKPPSSRYRPGLFWLLTSAGSSVECVPDLPSYGRGNDQENDQTDLWRPTEPWRPSDPDRKVVAPTGKPAFRRRGLIVGQDHPTENRMARQAVTRPRDNPKVGHSPLGPMRDRARDRRRLQKRLTALAATPARRIRLARASTTAGSNWVPAQLCSSAMAWGTVQLGRVGAGEGHGREGVTHRDDAGPQGDLVAGQPVRMAAAVEALVGGADQPGRRGQNGCGPDDALPNEGMAAHERPLLGVQRAGLVQEVLGDGELADVVELGRLPQLGTVPVRLIPCARPPPRPGGPPPRGVRPTRGSVLEGAQQYVAALAVRRAPGAGLLGVHALVDQPHGLGHVLALLGQQNGPVGGADGRTRRRAR